MNHQFTFSQYRGIDLTLFAVILIITESLLIRAAMGWFPDQLYTVSIVGGLTAIVLMRWGAFAGIHAFLGGLVMALLSKGSPSQYVIYCVGNLFSLLMLFARKGFGPQKIRDDAFLSVCFGVLTLLLMQLGRALISLVLGNPMEISVGFFTTDVLSLIFTGLIVWIARRLDGIFEDQKHYLLRLHNSEE